MENETFEFFYLPEQVKGVIVKDSAYSGYVFVSLVPDGAEDGPVVQEEIHSPGFEDFMTRDFRDYSFTELALLAIVLMMFFRFVFDLASGRIV